MYAQEQIKPYKNGSSKCEQVREMFNNIAHSYDTLNHTLSFGVDRWWRQCAIDFLKKKKCKFNRILDVATGTGDFALLASCELHPNIVIGCDISEQMLKIGHKKAQNAGLSDIVKFQEEDCAKMSFEDNSFDAVITAFALRNFEDLDTCLEEMLRVTSKGGYFVAIDLCAPQSFPMKYIYAFYKKYIIPALGRYLSRDNRAYKYLPQTMDVVPQARSMKNILEKAGFSNVKYTRLAFDMCILYTAEKK